MNTNRKLFIIVLILALVAATFCIGGCKKSEKETTAVKEALELCSKCGQVKGSELCCKPDQELCSKCGLVKGSPGCCKIK